MGSSDAETAKVGDWKLQKKIINCGEKLRNTEETAKYRGNCKLQRKRQTEGKTVKRCLTDAYALSARRPKFNKKKNVENKN